MFVNNEGALWKHNLNFLKEVAMMDANFIVIVIVVPEKKKGGIIFYFPSNVG
jgi:hypothetical protein